MSHAHHTRPVGHVLVPGAIIGSLSILLALGLSALRITERLDATIAAHFLKKGTPAFPKNLPEPLIWLASLTLAFALAFAVLSVPGMSRRIILCISTAVLITVWAPVLSLAAHAPEITTPLIAIIWSGICSTLYARNHQMPCDAPTHPPHR